MSDRERSQQHDWLTANGIKLHYVSSGSGSLMLMLHGFPEFWYSWRYQISEFAADFRVVALDLRGYNDSDKPEYPQAYAIAELLKDVKGAIAALGYEKCILVGHDWGGNIAWHFAYAYPEMVERLIVLNLPHPALFSRGLRTLEQLRRSWYIFAFQIPFLPEWLVQQSNYEAIASAFRDMAVDKTAFSDADLQAYKDAAAKPGALTAMLNYYRDNF